MFQTLNKESVCCLRWLPVRADDLILHSLLLYFPFEPIRRTGCLRLEPLLLALPVACAASSGSALCSALHCWGCCAKTEGEGRAPHQDYLNLRKNKKIDQGKEKQRHTKHSTRRSQKLQESKLNQPPRGQEEEKASFPIDLQYQVSKIHRKKS